MKAIVATLAVVLLVVLAGCGAAGSDVEGSPSVQPSDAKPSESDSTSTPASDGTSGESTPPPGSFPDGTSPDGITDPTAIVVAHLGHLDETSYTSSRTETYTTSEFTYSTMNHRSVDGPRQLMSVDYSGQSQEIYRGSNESPNYIRWESEGGVRYLVDHGDALFLGGSTFFIQSLLEAATFDFDRWAAAGDGMVFEFSVTSFELTPDLQSATPLESIDDLQGQITISEDGLISQLSVVLIGPDFEGVQTELQIEQSIFNLGSTTVIEPTWIAEAEERATVMSATLSPDRAYIEVIMERGDDLPAGSQGYIYIGDVSLETVFEEGIAPGQSFYIYETVAGELTVEMMAPDGADIGAAVPDGVGEVSVAVYHPDVGTVYVSTLSLGSSEP